MFTDRQRLRLEHIVDNADRIFTYVGRLSFEEFEADQMVVDAVERCLARITEAAVRAGEEAMNRAAPDIPFHVLRGFGNALRHDYDQIDLRTIWQTVKNDVPVLRHRCAWALARQSD